MRDWQSSVWKQRVGGLVAAVGIALAGCGSPEPSSALSKTSPTRGMENPDSGSESQQRQLQIFQQTLTNPSPDLDAATRQAAATELLKLRSNAATDILRSALSSGDPNEMTAVIAAIAREDRPEPSLEPAVLAAMAFAPADTWRNLGALLSRYNQWNPQTMRDVTAMALDPTSPPSSREAAVVALGEFHGNPAAAAERLIGILRSHPESSLGLLAMTSLAQLTGRSDLQEAEAWMAWWKVNRKRPAARWLRDTILAQARRIAVLESDLRQSDDTNRRVVARLVGVFRDLWPLLQVEEQIQRIPGMLEDDRAEVRAFAVERIAVLLRDGQATEEIELAVVERLGDPEVTIRLQAAALLPELSNPNIVENVTARLEFESDADVLNAVLRFLQSRGDRTTLAKFLPLLSRPGTREAAATTIWSLLKTMPPSDEERTSLASVLSIDPNLPSSPELAALWVLSLPTIDDRTTALLLQHPDQATRAVVAEALLRRGRFATLLAYGSDASIFPIAVQAALDMPARTPLERIDRLLALTPPVGVGQDGWSTALTLASAQVPLEQQVALDQRLAAHPAVADTVRITTLNRVIAVDELPMTTRIDVLQRLVPLLLETKQAVTAVALLDAVPDDHMFEDLIQMRFRSALLGRAFDTAAAIHSEPEPWILFFETTRNSFPEESEALRSEIVRRFNPRLDETMRTRLGLVTDPLMPTPGASATAETEGGDDSGS